MESPPIHTRIYSIYFGAAGVKWASYCDYLKPETARMFQTALDLPRPNIRGPAETAEGAPRLRECAHGGGGPLRLLARGAHGGGAGARARGRGGVLTWDGGAPRG